MVADESTKLVLEIPKNGLFGGGGTATFDKDSLRFRDKKIIYKDSIGIAYQTVKHSINLVPTTQTYTYQLTSPSEKIEIFFQSAVFIGNQGKKDIWTDLASLSKKLIEPNIVKKLLQRIFDVGDCVEVGTVKFTREGFFRKKLLGGTENVSWKEMTAIPIFSKGEVKIFSEKKGKNKEFASISMATLNAVVVPDLVAMCVLKVRGHK